MEFNTIFDTMQAARILGVREVGLGSILEAEFEVQQDKRNQRANWGLRPLPNHMLDYACQDTRYLIPLRDRLAERLNDRGLTGLASEDFSRLCKVKAAGGEEREPCWRIPGSQVLDGRERAILGELCTMREALAKTADRPPFKILSNESLAALAKAKPKKKEDLEDISGLSPRLIDRYGREILSAVEKGRTAPPILKPPRAPRPEQTFLDRLERLKVWRRDAGRKMEVESDIILPRDILEAVAARDPQDMTQLKKIMADVPWRLEHYGGEILSASLGKLENEP
jgi:ribonuclease D